MADNLTLNSGSGGGDLATDQTGGASGPHYQRVKLTDGTADSTTVIAAGNGTAATALRVTVASDSTGVLSVDDNGSSLTVDGTVTANAGTNLNTSALALESGGNLATIAGDTTSIDGKMTAGEGVKGAAVQRVTVATDDTLVTNSTAILADTASMDTNLGTVAGAVSAGQMQVDIVADGADLLTNTSFNNAFGTAGSADSQVLSVQGIASMTALTVDGSGVTQPVSGTITANLSATDNAVLDSIDTNTSKGTSHYRNIDANAEAEIKGSAGTLHWIHCMNLTAAKAYLHLYDNTAASVTPGTTTPNYTFALPTQGDTNGAGFTLRLEQAFANGITMVCTTTLDGSAGDPGTNGVILNAGYT